MLCTEFFKLTTYVCEMYPEKMSALPDELFKSLMASLEVGLTKYPYLLVGSSSPLVLTSGAQTGVIYLDVA